MRVVYNTKTEPINIDVETIVYAEYKTFAQMWDDADKRLKYNINIFYEKFMKNYKN